MSMRPFVTDVYSTDDRNETRRKRLENDLLESALKQMEVYSGAPGVYRIVLYRRLGGGGLSKMKVWMRPSAAS